MKSLQLHDAHGKQGAVFHEVAGWSVPRHYGDPHAEHAAVRDRVGIADLSHRGKLRVTGDDRVTWLQNLISNDIRPLKPGQGLYSSFLSHKGKILSYFRVYMLADAVLLEDVGEVGDRTYQALRKFLLFGTKAKMENETESWGLLLVSGPGAADLIERAFAVNCAPLPLLSFLTGEFDGREALFVRTEETGEVDIEILLPAASLASAWERLWALGAPVGLRAFGTEAREALRLEAGLPRLGAELTEEIVPPEANLEGKAFSLSKGCYPGQEVVARMDTYGSVRRRLVALVLHDPVIPAKGAKLFSGEREVGWISSAAHSPSFGCTIALGFPLRDFTSPGTALAVEVEGQRVDATVRPLPLYHRDGS
ncbi:CAF17-like 4Fe-4S cluster assembly/insertion protein YgfZ [Candidatus Nitrospira bockiana]